MLTDKQYEASIAEEGAYWDTFVAQWLMHDKMPGSIDFRIAFTQHRYESGWRPFCVGIPGVNFRMKEIRYILDTAARKPGMRILDLGCGAGWLSLEFARLGAHVTGIDISPINLAIGRHMAETNARNFPFLYQNFVGLPCKLEDFGTIEYVYGDLNKIDLPRQEYDAVVVADSLHHITDIEHLLEQVRYTLKPNGVFVGIDHAFATAETHIFNQITLPWLNDLYKSITEGEPTNLYNMVIEGARQRDWGVLNVDYDTSPVPDFEQFITTLFAELLEIVRSAMPTQPADKTRATGAQEEDEPEKESPFEDVSATRLAGVLIDTFRAERFSTVCPFIQADIHVPPFRSEQERLFQHYLSIMLIELGEYAIARGEAEGQWFAFCLKPEPPAETKPTNPYSKLQVEPEAWSNAGPQAGVTLYIRHLEDEIKRKNAALLSAEQYQRRLESELIEARKPKLPWKKGR